MAAPHGEADEGSTRAIRAVPGLNHADAAVTGFLTAKSALPDAAEMRGAHPAIVAPFLRDRPRAAG